MAGAASADSPTKRAVQDRKIQPPLLPGLPDHIAKLCLYRVNPSSLYSVCLSWRRLLYSPSFPPFLSLYALLSPPPLPPSQASSPPAERRLSRVDFASFDPVSSRWLPLPRPLSDQPLSLLIRHPSFLSRNFPIQSVSVSGRLVLLAATAHNFSPAIPCPLIFNPVSGDWSAGPPLAAPRRWCAAGTYRGAVYMASGVASHFSTEVARSVEKWDLNDRNHKWQKLRDLKDMRFSRDAIEAVGWRGKLCMVNVKGGAFREGIVYEVEEDTWSEMPKGMIGGWRGPAAAMDEAELYAVEEAVGALRRYDVVRDAWDDVAVSDDLKGAQQIAAAGGRVCAIGGGGGERIVVVDVVAAEPRTRVVENPEGSRALAVHVLPRMSWPNQ